MSRGIPMIQMGDECGRTQKGNNNAYCQDNEISWFDWTLPEKNKDIFDFTKKLIEFRRKHKTLFSKNEIVFHGVKLENPDLSETSHTLAFSIKNTEEEIYVGLNMYTESLTFELPKGEWKTVLSTDKNSVLSSGVIIKPHSSVILCRKL